MTVQPIIKIEYQTCDIEFEDYAVLFIYDKNNLANLDYIIPNIIYDEWIKYKRPNQYDWGWTLI